MKIFRISIITCILYFIHSTTFAQWSVVGTGVSNEVYALHVWHGKLYLGPVSHAGNISVGGIASYDGVIFDSLDYAFGIGGPNSIIDYKDTLYAGGTAEALGPWPYLPGSANIDKWDGTNWSTVGGGGPGSTYAVNSLAVYNGELYIGGNFITMGGVSVNRIARWDGTQWKNVGGGVTGGISDIYSMAVYQGELYVGGTFGYAGGKPAMNIARWNGTQWDSVRRGTDGIVQTMYADTIDNLLYIGGGFYNAGGNFTGCFAKWDGNNWSAVGTHIFYDNILAIKRYNNNIYAGGVPISSPPSVSDTVVSIWDGSYWCPMVPGPNGTITAMETYNGKLYIGGMFDTVGTLAANHIVTWGGNPCPNAGVNNITAGLKFNVFPNPAKKEINIKAAGDKGQVASEKYIVKIKNSLGQNIFEQKFEKVLKINTSNFKQGIYFVEVCTSEGEVCHTEKVIIE